MKYALLFWAGTFFSVFCYSQNAKTDTNVKPGTNKLKVTLIKDSLFVTDKDLLVPVSNIRALDSLIKKLPDPRGLIIHLETENAAPEKIKTVEAVLKNCHCPVTTRSISFNKQ